MYVAKPTTLTIDSVDFTDHIKGVTLNGGEEVLDARTFGKPRRTTVGGGQDSVVFHFLWSDALAKLIDTEAGTSVVFAMGVDGGSWGGTIDVPSAPPTPDYTVGELVEVDLACGVDELVYTASV